MAEVAILGCGYTGRRVAKALADLGHAVIATSRGQLAFEESAVLSIVWDVRETGAMDRLRALVSRQSHVMISIPTLQRFDFMPGMMRVLKHARRVLYLSTTGVHGAMHKVNEQSAPAPRSERELARLAAETQVAQAPHSLIVRPAAIYGPHRGIHTSLRAGTYQLFEGGTNFVSRIHVDDLAEHCIRGLFSDVTGAWPVADDEPCTSGEIAEYCASLLQIPLPSSVEGQALGETRRADRIVDGSAIRRLLGLTLRYPSYRVGIPACIDAEARERAR